MNRMCVRGLRRLLLHTILLNLFVSALTKNEFDSNPANGVEETRVVKVDGGPPGVVWVVQVSDIHISRLVPERGRALRRALGHALQLIKPAIVLISGDLTGVLFSFPPISLLCGQCMLSIHNRDHDKS